jgi:putative holliday junction resolvase
MAVPMGWSMPPGRRGTREPDLKRDTKISGTPLPRKGRLLGIDYGTKRVGLALSDPDQTLASPMDTLVRRDAAQDARRLMKFVDEYRIVGAVVGLPVHMSGDEGEKAREARAFAAWVAQVTNLPVAFGDERYTTAMADEQLRAAGLTQKQRLARRDKLAAQLLLQAFLEGGREGLSPGSLR